MANTKGKSGPAVMRAILVTSIFILMVIALLLLVVGSKPSQKGAAYVIESQLPLNHPLSIQEFAAAFNSVSNSSASSPSNLTYNGSIQIGISSQGQSVSYTLPFNFDSISNGSSARADMQLTLPASQAFGGVSSVLDVDYIKNGSETFACLNAQTPQGAFNGSFKCISFALLNTTYRSILNNESPNGMNYSALENFNYSSILSGVNLTVKNESTVKYGNYSCVLFVSAINGRPDLQKLLDTYIRALGPQNEEALKLNVSTELNGTITTCLLASSGKVTPLNESLNMNLSVKVIANISGTVNSGNYSFGVNSKFAEVSSGKPVAVSAIDTLPGALLNSSNLLSPAQTTAPNSCIAEPGFYCDNPVYATSANGSYISFYFGQNTGLDFSNVSIFVGSDSLPLADNETVPAAMLNATGAPSISNTTAIAPTLYPGGLVSVNFTGPTRLAAGGIEANPAPGTPFYGYIWIGYATTPGGPLQYAKVATLAIKST